MEKEYYERGKFLKQAAPLFFTNIFQHRLNEYINISEMASRKLFFNNHFHPIVESDSKNFSGIFFFFF